MKNIYLTSIINSQDKLTVNDLTVNQSLTLTGANPNNFLITDNDSKIQTFPNGNDRYLIEIDSATHIPSWTNNISIDEITTNTIKINSTTKGDILVIGDHLNNVDQLARGLNNQCLISDNGTLGLRWEYVSNLLNVSNGILFGNNSNQLYSESPFTYYIASSTSFTTTVPIVNITINVISGRRYKLTFNYVHTQGSGQSFYTLNVASIGNLKTYSTDALQSCESIITWYTATGTGSENISLTAGHNPNNAIGVVSQIHFLAEPLGY